jgi:hypothetical protein
MMMLTTQKKKKCYNNYVVVLNSLKIESVPTAFHGRDFFMPIAPIPNNILEPHLLTVGDWVGK